MNEKLLKNEIEDEELRIQNELREEQDLFNEKVLWAQDDEFNAGQKSNDKLAANVDKLRKEELKQLNTYEELKLKSQLLEDKLRQAEVDEKRKRLDLYYKEAEKQSSISEAELRRAEELIKKSYYIKEARDRINMAIEEKRDISKTKQIEYSSSVIDGINRSRKTKIAETTEMIDRIQLQKDFIRVRHARDQRSTLEMQKRSDARRLELTQNISIIKREKLNLVDMDDRPIPAKVVSTETTIDTSSRKEKKVRKAASRGKRRN